MRCPTRTIKKPQEVTNVSRYHLLYMCIQFNYLNIEDADNRTAKHAYIAADTIICYFNPFTFYKEMKHGMGECKVKI